MIQRIHDENFSARYYVWEFRYRWFVCVVVFLFPSSTFVVSILRRIFGMTLFTSHDFNPTIFISVTTAEKTVEKLCGKRYYTYTYLHT